MSFYPDLAQNTDFTFTPVRNFAPGNGTVTSFPISFKPSMPDTERGSIFVFWNDGELQHVDTIRVEGAGVQDTRSFSIQPPILTVTMCDSAAGTIYFTNTTCGTLEIDSLTLPNGIELPLPPSGTPQVPLFLQTGAADSLVVTISPGTEGSGTAPLQLGDTTLLVPAHALYTDKGGTAGFDTTLALQVHVERGPAAALLSDTALDFGTVSTCDSETLPLVLMSTGCDTLSGIGLRLSSSGFRIAGAGIAPLPVGSSDTIPITYIPGNLTNPSSDTLFLTTNAGTEHILLTGTAAPGASALALDTTTRNFGSLFECQQRDTTIFLTNPGCDTLRVDSAVFSNPAFSSVAAWPALVAPGDSIPVLVQFAGSSASTSGAVIFYSNANDGPKAQRVPLEATILPPAQLQVGLEAPTYAAHAGDLVTFYVVLTGDTGAAARELTGIQFDLTHNDDLLSYVGASGVVVTGTGTILHIAWESRAGSPTYADTIGTLSFRVYLTDSSETPLTLSNISFENSLGLAPDCIASIDNSGSGFTYLYRCGEQEIQNFMQTGKVELEITSVVPNPAKNALTVRVETAQPLSLRCQLFDALGKIVLDERPGAGTVALNSGSEASTFALDVSKLPSGMYFLRLSNGRCTQSRSVTIER